MNSMSGRLKTFCIGDSCFKHQWACRAMREAVGSDPALFAPAAISLWLRALVTCRRTGISCTVLVDREAGC